MKYIVINPLTFFLLVLISISAHADVLITEIGPSNHCTYFDENGDTPDWVELYNNGSSTVLLNNWSISDSAALKHALPLDGMMIGPGQYAFFAIEESTAGFKLSASGETVYLFCGDQIIHQTSYPALDQDVSWALIGDTYAATWLPTPGCGNLLLAEGEAFNASGSLRINELLTSAAPYKASEGYDYAELINDGKRVNLKGWQLQLGMAGSKCCTLPSKTLDGGDLYALYCTEDTIKSANTGFNLPAQGAILSLWQPDGTLADFIRLPQQYANISYGLNRERTAIGYLSANSFGRRNGTIYSRREETPVLSLSGGVYGGDSLTVEISAADGAEIRYTTNGDKPTAKSTLYTGPLVLYKTTALRAAAFRADALPSEDVSATYVLGLSADFPVVSLIIDHQYLFDRDDGLISGSTNGVRNYKFRWEYPAHLEYFDAEGNSLISQACGFGIQGDSSRGLKQKGFKLIARKSYGTPDTFAFNPFENRDFTEYKSFNLRAAGSEGPINPRFRDASLSSLAEGTQLLYSAAQPVLVYLNGEIYGHYNLRERINKYFIAQHTGLYDQNAIDHIDILSETGDWVRNGSSKDYFALSAFMKTNDLNIPANLEYVQSQMNIQSYFEYVAFMMATGNRDLSNSRFYRVPGGKWSWILYDLDRGLEKADNIAAFWLYSLNINHALELMTDHVPFVALMRVPAMREQFLTTLGEIMRTRFTTSHLISLIDTWHDKVAAIMPYQLSRWTEDTMHYWESLVEDMRRCARQRPRLVVQYTQEYFNLSDDELQRYFGAFLEADQ